MQHIKIGRVLQTDCQDTGSWLRYFLTMQLWASYLHSLCLSLLDYKMMVISITNS